ALLTDDFVGVGPFGFTLPKSEWMSRRDGGLVYETFDVDEITPRVYGDAALVTLRQRVRGKYQGQPIPEATRATLGLVKDRDDDEFDPIFDRIKASGHPYYADPFRQQRGEINHHDGGRGVYFDDPDNHLMEVITRPYGAERG